MEKLCLQSLLLLENLPSILKEFTDGLLPDIYIYIYIGKIQEQSTSLLLKSHIRFLT